MEPSMIKTQTGEVIQDYESIQMDELRKIHRLKSRLRLKEAALVVENRGLSEPDLKLLIAHISLIIYTRLKMEGRFIAAFWWKLIHGITP
jgi:hypothetical protein